MKILHYDEIDPQEAFMLNINALWWPLTPSRVEDLIKYDDRWSSDSLLYAVDKGKIVSQVVGLRIPTKTTDGEELSLGVAGVASHPSHKRRGFSTILMKELHDRSADEGMRLSFLLTRSSFVAYPLYVKLGYRDAVDVPRCTKPLIRRKKPKESILRKFRKKDVRDLDKVFERFSRDLYGHVLRQKNYFDWRLKISDSLKAMIYIVETKDGVGGYIVKRQLGADIFVQEMVVTAKKNMDRMFREIECGDKGDYITVLPLGGRKQIDYVGSRGYMTDEHSWEKVMVAPLKKSLAYKEISRMYGLKDGKFCLLGLDEF
ncbi:MAG: GNAT family N-acetyltransferase [Thermoplasmata archaeon]|nr:GNAT family N-acetyltransferase [Thermoplasmata archaeon]